jgi:hypothetical protein
VTVMCGAMSLLQRHAHQLRHDAERQMGGAVMVPPT